MQLVKQYKLSTYVAQNMSARAERILDHANKLNQSIGQGQTPMEEDEAKGLIEGLMSLTKGIEACFSYLFKEIKECTKVFEPETVFVELAPAPKPEPTQEHITTVTLEDFCNQPGGVSVQQLRDRLRLLAQKGQGAFPLGKVNRRHVYNQKDLKEVCMAWNPGANFGRKQNLNRGQTVEDLLEHQGKTAPAMVSLSDFVDQFELDNWRKNRLRAFLQQAYYDKAITFRTSKSHGPNQFYVYPADQLEVASKRWATQFLGNQGLLKKMG